MYIPLRVYSPLSVGFGAAHLGELTGFCRDQNIPAAGIADRDSLAGAMTVSKTLAKAGIQPLIGATVRVTDQGVEGDLVLFATSQAGYTGLLRIVNARNTATVPVAPSLTELAGLAGDATDGLVALTGGQRGLVDALIAAGKDAGAALARLETIFPGALYGAIQRPEGKVAAGEGRLVKLCAEAGIPLVATQEAHYAREDMLGAHDAFLCVANKTYLAESRRRTAEPGHYLVPADEMVARFADLPEAIANTAEIARRAHFMVRPEAPSLPAFPTPEGVSEDAHLRAQAADGLAERLSRLAPMTAPAVREDYETRLACELAVITKMGFPGYFLIVSDFIAWARATGIPVGPGRGSGAGSLVAYALGITDIDPLQFGLLFERFLNPARVSLPDFDIDFCQ